jgi:SAM-dependent methyltransferase
MSREDDAAKAANGRKPGSIPAPATVPRPSRPPGAPVSGPPPAPASTPPAARSVPPAAPTEPRAAAYANAAYVEDDFDAERTMVVDPDDAPTADYDPRANYDPRARGVFAPPPPPTLQDTEMPAAAAAHFDRNDVPPPRASEMKRRTSRRTVKIPDDTVRARRGALEAVLEIPVEAPPPIAPATGPAQAADEAAEATPPVMPAPPPVDGSAFLFDSHPGAREFSDDGTEEITVVKALRIIDIGNDPPPPIRSAFATWPPVTRERMLGSDWADEAVIARPMPPEPPPLDEDDEPEPPTPVAPAVRALPTPRSAMSSLPEISVAEQDQDLLEEIEPDATPIPPPKRPPPPPPKAKTESKPDVRAEDGAKRPLAWYEDLYTGDYVKTHDRLEDNALRTEVDFIEESLGMEKHAVVLDLACGFGDHASELASRGYAVVGLDLSQSMLDEAARTVEQRKRQSAGFVPPTFVQGDMREMTYEEAFDGAYCWATSFGFFDDEKNLAVLHRVHRALRQGGMFLLDVVNRDYVAPRTPSLVWFEGRACVCMDDVYVDFITSRLRVKRTAMFEGGTSRELDYSIRLYALHELGKMLHDVGFRVLEITGHTAHPGAYFGTESPRLIILAERS